jgi:NTP pyrophosphatase (non-canonical NTP hydrolase)
MVLVKRLGAVTLTVINEYQQLMAITAEECGELIQVCMKHIRKFDSTSQVDTEWSTKLVEEAGDVLCMIELMIEHGLLTKDELDARVNVKRDKLKIWSDLIK